MQIVTHEEGKRLVIALDGALDATTSQALKKRFTAWLGEGRQDFVVNMTKVEFVDSSGLGVLVGAFKRVRVGEGDLILTGLQSPVRKVFALTHLDRVFSIYPSVESALAA